jgi:predicted DNA-binding transcriptional regulator AlpA
MVGSRTIGIKMPKPRPSAPRAANQSPASTQPTPPPVEGERLLTKPEVLAKTGLSFVTIWRLMTRGAFPRSRQVASKAMWLGSEVDAWIVALPRVPLKGDPR